MASNTSLAARLETVPSATRSISAPRAAAETGLCSIPMPARLRAPKSVPVTQLAACLPSRPAATASKYSAISRSATSTPAS